MREEINGAGIEYEAEGSGPAVLILHGWGASIEAVAPIARCMRAIGFRTVSMDFPGFGKSDAPKEPWGVRQYADVTREFMRRLQLEGCDVICHSFGGRVVIMLASEEPALFNRLVLVDAAGVRPKRGIKYYAKTYAYKLGHALAKIGFIDRLFGLSKKQRDAGSEDYRALKSVVMRKTFVNVVNEDLSPRLDRIRNDTLLVWGDRDEATPMWMAKVMEKRIKRSGLAVLEGAGHFSYADNFSQFSAVMKAYFKNGEAVKDAAQ